MTTTQTQAPRFTGFTEDEALTLLLMVGRALRARESKAYDLLGDLHSLGNLHTKVASAYCNL